MIGANGMFTQELIVLEPKELWFIELEKFLYLGEILRLLLKPLGEPGIDLEEQQEIEGKIKQIIFNSIIKNNEYQ
tara:strand:+ start:1122 stop:1346 length:225 start_codon:yes stop_codon:yes gene_type:complete